MALVSVALTESAFEKSHPHIKGHILPRDIVKEKTIRKVIRKFLKNHKDDKLLVFVDKRSDKLGILVILKDECNKMGIKLNISLYCKGKNSTYSFKEVDLKLSAELHGMPIW